MPNSLTPFQGPRIPAFPGEALESCKMGCVCVGGIFSIETGTLAVLVKRATSQLFGNPPPQQGWGEPFQGRVGTHLFVSWHQSGFLQGSEGLAFWTRQSRSNRGASNDSFFFPCHSTRGWRQKFLQQLPLNQAENSPPRLPALPNLLVCTSILSPLLLMRK